MFVYVEEWAYGDGYHDPEVYEIVEKVQCEKLEDVIELMRERDGFLYYDNNGEFRLRV